MTNETIGSPSIDDPKHALGERTQKSQVLRPSSRRLISRPLASNERRGVLLVAAMLIALLATAAWLTPDPSGMGTHTQLGLPKCTMAAMTGLRCPGCGMTTSWSLVLRGEIETALATNLGGTMLCLLALFSTPILLGIGITGRTTPMGWFSKFAMAAVTVALAVAALQWMMRLMWG